MGVSGYWKGTVGAKPHKKHSTSTSDSRYVAHSWQRRKTNTVFFREKNVSKLAMAALHCCQLQAAPAG
jgi:hypothetical protein